MSFQDPVEYGTGLSSRQRGNLALVGLSFAILLGAGIVWLAGARNPYTPAGYVGYLTRGAVFGKSTFYGVQRGPTSAGRSWLLDVTNVSVTPYTYTEDFTGEDAVLSKDNLKIAFRVHTVWRVDEARVPLFMERFSTTVSGGSHEKEPDAIVKVAYGNFIREPLRTFARDEVQQRNGLEVKDALISIGDAVLARIRTYAGDSPFTITSVVDEERWAGHRPGARAHAGDSPHHSHARRHAGKDRRRVHAPDVAVRARADSRGRAMRPAGER